MPTRWGDNLASVAGSGWIQKTTHLVPWPEVMGGQCPAVGDHVCEMMILIFVVLLLLIFDKECQNTKYILVKVKSLFKMVFVINIREYLK